MKNVGIICGGFSSEFEISMLSGTNIHNQFPEEYNSFLVLLKKEGWFVALESGEVTLDSTTFSFVHNGQTTQLDLALVYIHGDPGENGKVQAYLEMIGIPYVNSGPLASQLSFDKWYCNQFLKGFGIDVAKSIYLTDSKNVPNAQEVVNELGLPIFVKPCDSGSSYGIARVNVAENLNQAIAGAFAEGDTVVLEAFLNGTEVTCGVFRTTEGIHALPLTEIVSKNEFFDYAAKYQGLSDEITPARISQSATDKVQEIAKKVYQLLNLRSIARIDFMLVGETPYVIEVNTTPGFTNESLVPKMLNEEGLSITEFWRQILEVEVSK